MTRHIAIDQAIVKPKPFLYREYNCVTKCGKIYNDTQLVQVCAGTHLRICQRMSMHMCGRVLLRIRESKGYRHARALALARDTPAHSCAVILARMRGRDRNSNRRICETVVLQR